MEASCSISPKYIIPNHVLTSDRVLGSGGFGVVHHGVYKEHEIAIKTLLRLSDHQILQFEQEVRLMSQINHENIVRSHVACFDREHYAS